MLSDVLGLFVVLALAVHSTLAAPSAGCGKNPPSSGTKTIGSNRQYILQVPANYNPSREYRLVFGFHWLSGNMNNVAPGYYGLRDLAQESAIFVAPNGLDAGWANTGGRDTTFVNQMLTEIKNTMCVDTTQIFATGFSYGGGMSYSLACSNPSELSIQRVIRCSSSTNTNVRHALQTTSAPSLSLPVPSSAVAVVAAAESHTLVSTVWSTAFSTFLRAAASAIAT